MPTTTTLFDRLHAALQQGGGTIPPDLIEPLLDLLDQFDHATGALEVRSGSDARELARMARKVAATGV